jgi:hypothetical protein
MAKKARSSEVGLVLKKGAAGDAALDSGEIFVKTGGRLSIRPDGAGYESRLWEKVTCKISPDIVNPEDLITNPAILGMKVTKLRAPARGQAGRRTK